MKKSTCIFLVLMFCVLMFGCGKSDNTKNNTNAAATSAQSEAEATSTKNDVATDGTTKTKSGGDVDIDLTSMSITVMYAEMSNMQIYPDNYKDKTVKIKGQYNEYQDEEQSKQYYAVVIEDATACCQQGMELKFTDGKAPNYNSGDEIEVTGTFDTYIEKVQNCDVLHCVLKNAEIL